MSHPRRFRLSGVPTEVVIGPEASGWVGEEVARLGASRALVVTTARRRGIGDRIAGEVGARAVGVLAIAEEHVPVEIAERGREEARRVAADVLVPVGGGSTIGLAKAIALTQSLPIIAVPSTYSGSEMTPVWGLTEAHLKKTGRDDRVRAVAALYDPRLSQHLPPKVAVPSAFNALAHAVETLYAPGASEAVLGWAETSVGHLVRALPALASGSDDLVLREGTLEGSCLAGACLG